MEGMDLLHPAPRSLRANGSALALAGTVAVAGAASAAQARLAAAFEAAGLRVVDNANAPDVQLDIDAATPGGPEAYALEISAAGAWVRGADAAGLFHGTGTLAQLVRLGERTGTSGLRLRGVAVEDRPVFRCRGVMLDVSRDRVPTLETLFELVELLSSLKFNQLQLYTEHTFAYAGHEAVWRGADPLTPHDVRALDRFCAERFVELVPNQQSLGHFHRWLVHAPYRALAECPAGIAHPFTHPDAPGPEPFSLCPVDPGALELLADLYGQLLPCFSSRTLNVGLDETFDLGRGRSRAACEERGRGRVYLDYLCAVAELARGHGRRVQFWADVILEHPELVGALPPDLVPCLWGYEANHPFEEQCRTVAAAGLEFLVCPGTSSWQSLAGRLANMTANIAAAARHGRASGAAGLLVTDWGDRGHLQPLPASFPGWIVAAGEAWNPDAPAARRSPEALAALLSTHVLCDPTGCAGRVLVRLAAAGETTGVTLANASPLSVLLTHADQACAATGSPAGMEALSADGLERALAEVDGALTELSGARMAASSWTRQGGELFGAELTLAGGLQRLACLLGLRRLHAGRERSIRALDAEVRAALAGELGSLIEEHRRLWPARSRPGGLERSAAWLERLLRLLD